MMLDNGLKPTVIKTNARYRGPSESDKYRNLVGEVAHDLKLLATVMGGDPYGVGSKKGQVHRIWDNMYAYFSGDSTDISSTVEPGSMLYATLGPAVKSQELMSADWVTYGGCTKTQVTDGVELTSPGTVDPCGVKQIIDVAEGKIVSIRAKVKRVSGTATNFSIGSADVNQMQGSISTIALSEDSTSIYVQHIFECKHRESITINVDVHRGELDPAAVVVQIQELYVSFLEKNELVLQPLNTTIKTRIGLLEDEVSNILKNM